MKREYGTNGKIRNRRKLSGDGFPLLTTFPDVKIEPLNIVAEGEWVVARRMLSGTHEGTGQHPFVHEGLLAGVPPTGKKFKAQHMRLFRLRDGLIVEHCATRDDVGMARRLGLLPEAAMPASK